jgi:predicted DNA-binding transcriptional regulator AlpA
MQPIDLSGWRMVSLPEVSQLFGISEKSVTTSVWNGTFPVRPKAKRPYRWSSVELREYFEDARRRR